MPDFASLARCKLVLLCLAFSLTQSTQAIGGEWAGPTASEPSRFALSLELESVNDSVNYTPNLPSGRFAEPQEKPRFHANKLRISFSPPGANKFYASISQRQLTSLRDAFVVNQVRAGLQRRLPALKSPQYNLAVGVDAMFNYASELYKNSYTDYDDQLITEVRLIEPRDTRLSAQAQLGISLPRKIKVHVDLIGGFSHTSQKSVKGASRLSNQCNYEFNATESGGSVHQLGQCGQVVSFKQTYPNDAALNNRLGFSVAKDVSYRDYFLGTGVSLGWSIGPFLLNTGYQFRQYFRPTIDDRIRAAGGAPVTRSHNAFASTSITLFTHWQVNVNATYQSAAFLDDIPLLYTALTHQRYGGKGVIRYALSLVRFF